MASLKKCIEEKCKDCTYDQFVPGSWRSQVESCRVFSCPLWEVRPVTMETMLARRNGTAPAVATPAKADAALDDLIDNLEDEENDTVAVAA
jgi:hypothetical protein